MFVEPAPADLVREYLAKGGQITECSIGATTLSPHYWTGGERDCNGHSITENRWRARGAAPAFEGNARAAFCESLGGHLAAVCHGPPLRPTAQLGLPGRGSFCRWTADRRREPVPFSISRLT